MEEVTFKQRPALLDARAFESPGPRDSSQELLEEAKVSPPEVQGFDPAYRPASSTQDPELNHFMVTAAKSISNLHKFPPFFPIHVHNTIPRPVEQS